MQNFSNLKIFLVDDEEYCRELFEQYLINIGCTKVQTFSSSTDCLNQINLQPDLIFLDYHMDKLDGIETLKKIKRVNPDILVVFISGQADIRVAVNALKYGAFDYLLKEETDERKMTRTLEKVLEFNEMISKGKNVSTIRRIMAGMGIAV